MYLAYMDESGNSGTKSDPNQPIHLLGCLVVEESRIRAFEEALHAIAVKHFSGLASKTEFKGADLFSGSGDFKHMKPPQRIEIATAVLEATVEHAAAWGYTGIDKTKSKAGDHPHRICFSLMLEGLQPYLAGKGALGLIVADEYNEISQTIITDLHTIKKHGTFWGYKTLIASNIVDSVHFVESRHNRLIQASDLATYITLKKLRIEDARWAEWLAIPAPRPTWFAWKKTCYTKSEAATIELAKLVSKIPHFRTKVWPD